MTTDQLDNTIFELIRLELVRQGYLPDQLLYSTEQEFTDAKQALIDNSTDDDFRIITLHNVGSNEARGESHYPKILIDREEEPEGDLGAHGITEFQEINVDGEDRFQEVGLPTSSSEVVYELTTGTESRRYEVIMDQIIRNALKNMTQHQIFVEDDNAFTGETFFMKREQKIDLSTSELIEKQIRYRASDLWLEDCVLQEGTYSPITEINVDICAVVDVEEAAEELIFNFSKAEKRADLIGWIVENEENIQSYIIEYTTNGFDWASFSTIPVGTPPSVPGTDYTYNEIMILNTPFLSTRIRVIGTNNQTVFISGAMPERQYLFDGISYNSSNQILTISADNNVGVQQYEAMVVITATGEEEVRGVAEVNQGSAGQYFIFVDQETNDDWVFIRVRAVLDGSVCVYSDNLNIPLTSGVVFDNLMGTTVDGGCSYKIDWIVSEEDDIIRYEIYRGTPTSGVKIGEVLQGETYTFTDTNGVDGINAYYVKAVGAGGDIDSNGLLGVISCSGVYYEDVFEDVYIGD